MIVTFCPSGDTRRPSEQSLDIIGFVFGERTIQRWTASCLTSWAARSCLRRRPKRWRWAAEITWKSLMENIQTCCPAAPASETSRTWDRGAAGMWAHPAGGLLHGNHLDLFPSGSHFEAKTLLWPNERRNIISNLILDSLETALKTKSHKFSCSLLTK